MRRFFNGLVVGIVVGAAGYWYVQNKTGQHASASETAGHVSEGFKAKLEALDLSPDQIKDELSRTGKIVRRKALDIGEQVSDAAADARIEAAIKAKYAMDPNLSVWKISVSSTQGHVTLSGTVSAPEDIARAVALALDAEGARDVISTLQVKPAG